MPYNFSNYIKQESKEEFIKFVEPAEEENIKELGKKMEKQFEELLLMQHDIGNNRKNIDRKYASLMEQKLQKHEEAKKKRSFCIKL